MSVCFDVALLQRFLDGDLTGLDEAAVRQHVETCADCQRRLEELTGPTTTWVRPALAFAGPGPAFLLGLKRASPGNAAGPLLTLAEALPSLPDYELLEVLGRGGMGVVYRARQTALNRQVAVKMIRQAELAGPDELARFRLEGEILARVQHANVVQVHEVGV